MKFVKAVKLEIVEILDESHAIVKAYVEDGRYRTLIIKCIVSGYIKEPEKTEV